jgi:hypothetical protein
MKIKIERLEIEIPDLANRLLAEALNRLLNQPSLRDEDLNRELDNLGDDPIVPPAPSKLD